MENMYDIVKARHSVRSYTNQEIKGKVKDALEEIITTCNQEGKLNIQLVLNEPKAFDTFMAHYGNFDNVNNYIVMIGKKSKDLEEKCGYYGEKIVLKAQELGLNTCWVGLTYGKRKVPCKVEKDEKIVITISVGYGVNQGAEHKSKSLEEVTNKKQDIPNWYKKGIEYALLAPTAMNQQKFKFDLLSQNTVKVVAEKGFFTKVDLGIVKYHFELGAGKGNFKWSNNE